MLMHLHIYDHVKGRFNFPTLPVFDFLKKWHPLNPKNGQTNLKTAFFMGY